MAKIKNKINVIIALEIIITMTLYYFVFAGFAVVTYAIDFVKTNNTNVDFSAYFINSNGEKVKELEENIDEQDVYLYVDVSVKNEGYFNGSIKLNNNNFNIKQEVLSSEIAEISGNEVKLKQINAGNTAIIKLKIEAKKDNVINESVLKTKTNIELNGQYVDSKNIEKNKYININGTTEVEMSWKSSENTNAELESNILTNSIYEVNGEEQRIVQILINSKITNNNYPVKNTEITLNVLDNVKEIKVHSRSIDATNNNIDFNENNYTYDKENKKLTIKLSNEDTNNISWNKNVQDIFVVTYVFNKEENPINKNIEITQKINTYDNKVLEGNKNVFIEKEIDGIITSSIENAEDSIYKGKIYTGETRDYTVINKINIDYLYVLDNINIKECEATYLSREDEKDANIIYKQTKISKNEFLKIFGEDGYITIKNNQGEIISNINKDSDTDEEGKILINYTGNIKEIELTTSKPINVGTINIENTKSILNSEYPKEVVDSLTGIKELAFINDKELIKNIDLKQTQTVANIEVETEKIFALEGTQSLNLKIKLDKKDESKKLYKNAKFIITLPSELTNVELHQANIIYGNGLNIGGYELTTNENGQYQIIITTSGEQQNYDLTENAEIHIYANVNIGILTPTQTKTIELDYTNENDTNSYKTNTNLYLESTNGLMLYNKVIDYNNANDSIQTYENNTQTGILDRNSTRNSFKMATALVNNYEKAIYNVVIVGKIPSGTDENNTYESTFNEIVTNQDATIYYSTNADANPEDDSWTEDKTNAKAYKIVINTVEAKQVIKISLQINIPQNLNYNEQGEFITKVTYQYENMNFQKSNNIILKTETSIIDLGIDVEGVGQTFENGLQTNIVAITGNKELKDNDNIFEGQTIKYYITVANWTNQKLQNVKLTVDQSNSKLWKIVDIETFNPGTQENQIEKHYMQTEDTNIELDTIETMEIGESVTLTYEAYANDIEENTEGTMYGTINIKAEEQGINEDLKTLEAVIKQAEWKLAITEGRRIDADLYDGDTLKLNLDLTNQRNEKIESQTIKIIYSSQLKHVENSIYLNTDYFDEEEKKMISRANIEGIETNDNGETVITLKISNIEANEKINISLYPEIYKITNTSEDVKVKAFVESSTGEQYVSNDFVRNVIKKTKDIIIEAKSFMDQNEIDSNTIVKHESTLSIEYSISNNGSTDANLEMTKSLVNGLDNITVTKQINGETIDITEFIKEGIFIYNDVLKANSTEKIIFTGQVNLTNILEDKLEYEFLLYDMDTNVGYSKNVLFTTNKSEIVEDSENPDEENPEEEVDDNDKWGTTEDGNGEGDGDDGDDGDDGNDGDDGDDGDQGNEGEGNEGGNENNDNKNDGENEENNQIKKYTISGVAWEDSDADGKRIASEKIMQDIKILVINSTNGSIVTETTTNSDGKYTVTLQEGKYILLFLYNDNQYYVTTYQAKDIDETVNSDVIKKEVTIDGKNMTVGATDTINLISDIKNIDIGLVYRTKFDLKVEKSIKKVTVSNSEGTKSTEYNNATLAKAEISAKALKDSLVVVEYTIKITNIGEVAGCVGEIIDDIPSSLDFKSNLNSNWYLNNNKLYNRSLEDKKLDVNESAEVTLVLTKTMTESNTGLVNNVAYIQNSYNEKGVEDSDTENDKSSANLMISVKTGVVVRFFTVTLILIILEFIGVYIINKKVLMK